MFEEGADIVHVLFTHIQLFAYSSELFLPVAAAEDGDYAAAADIVQNREIFRQPHRVVQGGNQRRDKNTHIACARGDGGSEYQG